MTGIRTTDRKEKSGPPEKLENGGNAFVVERVRGWNLLDLRETNQEGEMKRHSRATALLLAAVWLFSAGLPSGVAQQARPRLSDAMITTMVEHRLMDKMVLREDNIEVRVRDGAVTLTGTVRSLAEWKRAEKEALDADDVSNVSNDLRIATEDRTDQQIAADLGGEIRRYVFYDIFDWIEGSVEGNVVTLRGSVREPWRKADYERLAEGVAGVTGVKNDLEVLPLSTFDDQLRIGIARRLYGDPRFIRYANRSLPPIHLVVKNGRVTLEGVVATPLERQLAESIVRTGSLTFEVVNRLRVENDRKAG